MMALVAYGSMYGNTAAIGEAIAASRDGSRDAASGSWWSPSASWCQRTTASSTGRRTTRARGAPGSPRARRPVPPTASREVVLGRRYPGVTLSTAGDRWP